MQLKDTFVHFKRKPWLFLFHFKNSHLFLIKYSRRLKGGNLEPHPFECSIIVNYKLEAAVYNNKDMADPMLADKKVHNFFYGK